MRKTALLSMALAATLAAGQAHACFIPHSFTYPPEMLRDPEFGDIAFIGEGTALHFDRKSGGNGSIYKGTHPVTFSVEYKVREVIRGTVPNPITIHYLVCVQRPSEGMIEQGFKIPVVASLEADGYYYQRPAFTYDNVKAQKRRDAQEVK